MADLLLKSQLGPLDADQAEQVVDDPELGVVNPGPDDGGGHGQGDVGQEVNEPEGEHAPHRPVDAQGQDEGQEDSGGHGHEGVVEGVAERLEEDVVANHRPEVRQAGKLRGPRSVPTR